MKAQSQFVLWFCSALMLFAYIPAASFAATTIKVALVTPEGSAWTKTLQQMAKEVRVQTKGQVRFRIYPGGVAGDELDVLRKMKANRIHAAGFSGVGLGTILPSIRLLEAPLLFSSHAELDAVKAALFDEYAHGFERAGYVLLGFAEAGFVYLFSDQQLNTASGLEAARMWSWKGDPVAADFMGALGLSIYPLHLADVNLALARKMIDSFYAPPLAAVAFQWHSQVKYVLDLPVVNSTGALLITARAFKRLSPTNQGILRELANRFTRKLVVSARQDNQTAMVEIEANGVQRLRPSLAMVDRFTQAARQTYNTHLDQLYPKALFDKAMGARDRFRNQAIRPASGGDQ